MLVGPTGAGKTTTLVKMAAQFSERTQRRAGVITLDCERIAASERLKTFAEILEVPFAVAFSAQDLFQALGRQWMADLVLIDTAGHSPFRPEPLARLERCAEAAGIDRTLLVLPLATRGRDAVRLAQRYHRLKPSALVVTKFDETDNVVSLLDILGAAGLPLSHVTMGPSVPEDLAQADAAQLVSAMARQLGPGPETPRAAQ